MASCRRTAGPRRRGALFRPLRPVFLRHPCQRIDAPPRIPRTLAARHGVSLSRHPRLSPFRRQGRSAARAADRSAPCVNRFGHGGPQRAWYSNTMSRSPRVLPGPRDLSAPTVTVVAAPRTGCPVGNAPHAVDRYQIDPCQRVRCRIRPPYPSDCSVRLHRDTDAV